MLAYEVPNVLHSCLLDAVSLDGFDVEELLTYMSMYIYILTLVHLNASVTTIQCYIHICISTEKKVHMHTCLHKSD